MGWLRRRERAVVIAPDAVDQDHFRRVLSHFCSGVVVVTAMSGGHPVGLTCQSFSSLSLSPPLVMFGAARDSRSWPEVRAAGRFAVNILGEHQEEVSRTFARSGVDKFAGLSWRAGITGAPLLEGALAHLECSLEALHDGGDHEIVVGRVVALAEPAAQTHPLLFFRSTYHSLRPDSTPAA